MSSITPKVLFWALAAALSFWASGFAIDFSVYWTIALAHIRDGRALYAADFLPWPMWYRYPPLFAWLVFPLALLPFRAAAFVWALGKCAAAARLTQSLLRGCMLSGREALLAAAVAGPYFLSELRYGNAQFHVFALVAAALLVARARPSPAGLLLGLATALKVWPLFFVPYLAARGLRRAAGLGMAAAVAFTLLPALWTGFGAHWQSLMAWYAQESAIAADAGRIWFPSQSLLGVLTRHLTFVDWSAAPDSNYPRIDWLTLDPETVRMAWLALAALGYGCLLWLARRLPERHDRALHGIAFCALLLLEPFAQKQSALAVLLWPALVAATTPLPSWRRRAVWAAAAVSLLQVVTFSSWLQRLYQVIGLDALVILLLALALLPFRENRCVSSSPSFLRCP